jgi:hypothetical protein
MNTVQSTQEKRTIKVKDFLEDFRAGTNDQDLQTKYHLTQLGLEKFYGMLMDRGILSPQELQENYRSGKPDVQDSDNSGSDTSAFICPRCLASHETMFDTCPNCGVSFQAMIGEQPVLEAGPQKADRQPSASVGACADMDSELDGIFGVPPDKALVQHSCAPLQEDEFCGRPRASEVSEFSPADEYAKFRHGYDDSADEVLSGMPLDYAEPCSTPLERTEVRCDGCQGVLEPISRSVYDQKNTVKTLAAAGIVFLLSFLTSAALHYFTGYSFARLLVVYSTGILLLVGSVLLTVGTFLWLARQKVYCCPACRRVYPRG